MKKLVRLVTVLIILSMSLPLPAQAAGAYAISGKITIADGSGLAGVTVALGTFNTTTDSDGSYTIPDVPEGTSGSLTPAKDGYTFDPATKSIDSISDNISGQDFLAAPVTFSLSGKISTADGKSLTGVNVVFGDLNAATDSDGVYTIKGVPAGASGSLTPSKDGYTLDPISRSITAVTGDLGGQDFSASQKTFSISGKITTPDGGGLEDVTITYGAFTATTAADGSYTLENLPYGASGSLTPAKDGYTFTSNSLSAASVKDNLTSQDFIAAQTITYTISGAITISGGSSGLAGVIVSMGSHHSAPSNASGVYSITSVPAGSVGTLIPSLAGYSFAPTSRPVTALSGDLTAQDFSASVLTYTVSGKISGAVLAGVNVSDGTTSTTTDSNGAYSFSGEPYGTSLVLTPSLAGYTFSPAEISINSIKGNQTGKNFTSSNLTLSISGKVTLNGKAMAGVTISDGLTSTTTNSLGNYILSKIPYNNSNITTLTASRANYVFTPATFDISNLTGNLTGKNFAAAIITYSISGNVSKADGTGGLDGVKIDFCSTYSTTTANGGAYTLTNVPIGRTCTLTAFLPGYSMTPVSRTISHLASNVTGQDFSAAVVPVTFSISGKVTYSFPLNGKITHVVFPGVTVSFGPYNTVTAADGTYTINLIARHTAGQLVATKYGYSFGKKNIAGLTADLTEQNFAADQVTYTIYGKVYSSEKNLSHVKIHVTANGIPSSDGITDSSGQYFLRTMPSDLTYVLTPDLTGYTFSPSKTTIDNLDDNSSNDFKGTLHYESISGVVSGLGNTTIRIRYGSGKTQFTTTADDGSYTFKNLPQSVSYTLTPISPLPPLSIFRFEPINRIIPAGSGNLSGQDFTATQQVVMSGKVTIQGKPIKGVTVLAAGFNTLTDVSGKYSLWVPDGASITPAATHPYFIFTDTVTPVTPTQNFNQDWSSAEVKVSGKALLNGAGLKGVVVSASAAKNVTPASATTDSNGSYTLTVHDTDTPNLAYFVVTPVSTGYTFSPRSQTASMVSSLTKNFVATANKWNVSGTVTLGQTGLSGVEIDATINGIGHKLFTNSRGAFTFTNVPFGVPVILSAKKYGYSFSTTNTYPTNMGNANLPLQDFSATALNLDRSISGTITLKDTLSVPLANVLLTLTYNGDTIFTTRTNANGNYTFPNLVEGSGYIVTPALANYVFNPKTLGEDLTTASTPSQNFNATRVAKLSGRIYGLPANTLTVDFNIAVNSNAPSTQTINVDSLGRYVILIPNLPFGNSYTVTPVPGGTTIGYTFNPASYTFAIGPATTSIAKNFTAVHP